MTTAAKDTWYTITVVQHEGHPRKRTEGDPQPVEIIACTVLPHLAGDILRAAADQIPAEKPTMRAAER